jgi:hypothetical protein
VHHSNKPQRQGIASKYKVLERKHNLGMFQTKKKRLKIYALPLFLMLLEEESGGKWKLG